MQKSRIQTGGSLADAHVRGACILLLFILALVVDVRSQGRASHDPAFVPRVKSMADLAPKTAEERAQARFFSAYGHDKLVPGAATEQIVDRFAAHPYPIPAVTYSEFVTEVACSAKVILVGVAKPTRVLLNSRGSFLFTQYTVAVEQWIAPAGHGPGSITVLTPGGQVSINGQLTVAQAGIDITPDLRHMFFLDRIGGTSGLAAWRNVVPADSEWDRRLPYLLLPPELKRREVTFDRFADDLAGVARRCRIQGK